MDRAAELRTLMKIATKKADAKGSSQQTMSGKDKAKMLKMMKEKQKPEQTVAQNKVMNTIERKPETQVKTQYVGHGHQQMSNNLPTNFFEDNQPSTTILETKGVKQDSTSGGNQEKNKINTSLPVGFFDNPTEELTARGVNIQQHIAEQKKVVDNEFQSFLNEIDELQEDQGVDPDLLQAATEEDSGRDLEEEAVQMAYLTQLAVLYQKSDAVIDKQNIRSRIAADGEVGGSAVQEDAAAVKYFSSSSGGSARHIEGGAEHSAESSSSGVLYRQDVDDILYRKLQVETLRKRRLQQHALLLQQSATQISKRSKIKEGASRSGASEEEAEQGGEISDDDSSSGDSGSDDSGSESSDEEYSPLSFMDWTAKAV